MFSDASSGAPFISAGRAAPDAAPPSYSIVLPPSLRDQQPALRRPSPVLSVVAEALVSFRRRR
jgi:hypothetical protein